MQEYQASTDERRVSDHDRFYEKKYAERPVYVGPGQFECTDNKGVVLVSKAGSGVVVCVHDHDVGVGGMMQLIMPEKMIEYFPKVDTEGRAYEYVADLVERFINSLKRYGAGKSRVRIKLYGGTSIFEEIIDCGLKNYVFAKEKLVQKGLMIASEDIGGDDCRRVFFLPADGKINCYKMRRKSDKDELRAQERAFMESLARQFQKT